MKLPKTANRYCPYCKHHTEHKILLNKKRAPSSLSRGSKYRARKRGKARDLEILEDIRSQQLHNLK